MAGGRSLRARCETSSVAHVVHPHRPRGQAGAAGPVPVDGRVLPARVEDAGGAPLAISQLAALVPCSPAGAAVQILGMDGKGVSSRAERAMVSDLLCCNSSGLVPDLCSTLRARKYCCETDLAAEGVVALRPWMLQYDPKTGVKGVLEPDWLPLNEL